MTSRGDIFGDIVAMVLRPKIPCDKNLQCQKFWMIFSQCAATTYDQPVEILNWSEKPDQIANKQCNTQFSLIVDNGGRQCELNLVLLRFLQLSDQKSQHRGVSDDVASRELGNSDFLE